MMLSSQVMEKPQSAMRRDLLFRTMKQKRKSQPWSTSCMVTLSLMTGRLQGLLLKPTLMLRSQGMSWMGRLKPTLLRREGMRKMTLCQVKLTLTRRRQDMSQTSRVALMLQARSRMSLMRPKN